MKNPKWIEINKKLYQTEFRGSTFQISKSGSVWELIEVLERSSSKGVCYSYLSNTKSFATAKSLIKKYAEEEIYFDEKCRPKNK